jgi:2,4-diketo-3-deoxy-L-fuconate hydrolase
MAYISQDITLLPGDIISTGTPSGVGIFRDPPIVLKPGDIVECRVDGIGAIVNTVKAAE